MKIILITLSFLSFATVSLSNVIYVKKTATGMNTGTSWNDAFTNLSNALIAALNGDTIWIATGTYKPDRDILGNLNPIDNRSKCFKIGDVGDTLRIVGGFLGYEINESQSNPKLHIVNVDGDIGVSGDYIDNCYRLFEVNLNRLELTGIRFRNGNSNQSGSAIFIRNNNVETVISNCEFQNNHTTDIGGCIYNASNNILTIENSDFTDNSADIKGGAIFSDNLRTIINNCFFKYCDSNKGGAIYLKGGSSNNPHIVCFTGFYNCAPIPPLNQAAGTLVYGDSSYIRMSNCSSYSSVLELAIDMCFDFQIRNSILNDGIVVSGNDVFNFENCIFQSSYVGNGSNNINQDPHYIFGTLKIDACSPARNTGDNNLIENEVQLPEYGIQEGNIEIGAYEFILPILDMDSSNLFLITPLEDLTFQSYFFVDCNSQEQITIPIVPFNPSDNPSWIPDSTGMYAFVISSGGCLDTSNCVSFVSYVGLDENYSLEKIELFPNPSFEKIWISISPELINTTYQILNSVGLKMEEGYFISQTMSIDLKNYLPGIYYLNSKGHNLKFIRTN